MASLRPPFDANSLHELAGKIVKGKFLPVPKFYSEELNMLIGALLTVDPRKRPNINQILKFSLLKDKIPNFLGDQIFKDEFSHTIIHNKKFFDDKGNAIKPKLEAIQEEQENYVKYIKKCIDSKDNDYYDEKQYQQYKPKASEDRNEEYEISEEAKKEIAASSDYDFSVVDFNKFTAFMEGKFGADVFSQGYKIINKYRSDMFNNDHDLTQLVRGLVSSDKQAYEFVSYCSKYMILENLSLIHI